MSEKDIEEFNALTSVLSSHTEYKNNALRSVLNPKKLKFDSLSLQDKQLLPWFPDYLEKLAHSIDLNNSYFSNVARLMGPSWGVESESEWVNAKSNDTDKFNGLIAQYIREWSSLGSLERKQSMDPILNACELLYPDVSQRPNIEILVPGAGLGRLVVEFVKRGFKTQGNDISYHMLLNSNFILNNTFCENQYVICPFINKSSNILTRNDQLKQVYFPDFNPGDISLLNNEYPEIKVDELMSMVAGGFEDLYGPPNLGKISNNYSNEETSNEFRKDNAKKFNVITTCFFLDTSSNILDTLNTIKHSLKDDGYWINFGPLLWHFEDNDQIQMTKIWDEDNGWKEIPVPLRGLELSRDDLIQLIKDSGFSFIEHKSNIETTYGGYVESQMGGWKYKAEFWVCQKTTLCSIK